MPCKKLIRKVFFNGTSLAVILLTSAKLVLACQSVICNNGLESDTCAIGKNQIAFGWYFNLSLAVFIVVTTFYFVRGRKGLLTVIFCIVAISLPIIFRLLSGNENCDFSATEIARWTFYTSILPLVFQLTSWITELRNSEIKLN